MQDRMLKKAGLCLTLTLTVGVFLLISSCSSRSVDATLSCVEGSVSVNGAAASQGIILSKNSSINTGSASFAVISLSDTSFALVSPDSEVVFLGNDYSLRKGTLFVSRNKASYKIKTSCAIAELKEAAASVSLVGDSVQVRLFTGNCVILPIINGLPNKKAKANIVERYRIDVADGRPCSVMPLGANDFREYSLLSQIKVSPNLRRAAENPQSLKDIMIQADSASLSISFKLRKIAQQYGSLSVVTTRQGKNFTGAVSIRGPSMQIITVDGKVAIPSRDVKRVERYQE